MDRAVAVLAWVDVVGLTALIAFMAREIVPEMWWDLTDWWRNRARRREVRRWWRRERRRRA